MDDKAPEPLEAPSVTTKEALLRWCREFTEEEIHVVEAMDRAGFVVKKGTGDHETRSYVSYETVIRLAHLMEFLT